MNRINGKKYSLFVVDDEDFDNLDKDLPYMTKEKLKGTLGFANPETGEAYVRKTGVAMIDDATLEHEFDELLANVSPHEVEGIRYKTTSGEGGFWHQLGELFTGRGTEGSVRGGGINDDSTVDPGGSRGRSQSDRPIGGSGPAQAPSSNEPLFRTTPSISSTPNVLGTTPSIVSGNNSLTNRFNESQSKDNVLGSPVTFGGTKSVITGGVNRGLTATPSNDFNVAPLVLGDQSQTPNRSVASRLTANNPNVSVTPPALEGASSDSSLTPAPKVLGQENSASISNSPSPAINSPVNAPAPHIEPAPSFMSTLGKRTGDFLSNPQNLLGLGTSLSSMLVKQPKFEMPSSVDEIRQKLISGGQLTDQGRLAQAELGNILKSTPTELYPTANDEYYNAALRRTRESYAEAEKQLDAAYNNAGMFGSGEHMAEKAKLKEQLARTESGLYSETEQRRFELARTAKYQAVQDALNVDKNTMDDLVGLTGLDVQTAAMAYGAKVADVQAIREALGTIGTESVIRGKPKQVTAQTQSNIMGQG